MSNDKQFYVVSGVMEQRLVGPFAAGEIEKVRETMGWKADVKVRLLKIDSPEEHVRSRQEDAMKQAWADTVSAGKTELGFADWKAQQ